VLGQFLFFFLRLLSHLYITVLYFLLVDKFRNYFKLLTFFVCLLPPNYVLLYACSFLFLGTVSLFIFIFSLFYEPFDRLVLAFLKFYLAPEYFSLYGNPGSTLLASTAFKKALAATAKGGGTLISGLAVIGVGDHIGKTLKLDQVASHTVVETLNSFQTDNYVKKALDSSLPTNPSLFEKALDFNKKP
jgi:hypothetical protein